MNYRIAYQGTRWEARSITEVPHAGWLNGEVTGQALRLTGWALAREGELTALEARSLSGAVLGAIDRPSPDVVPLGAGAAKAANCRFELDVPISAEGWNVDWTLWAIDSEGRPWHFGTVLLEPELSSDRPVLVVGAARSGTTAVGDGLRKAMGLTGYGECHTLPLLAALAASIDRYYVSPNAAAASATEGVLLSHVEAAEWRARAARATRSVYHNLHRGPFVDKTPGAEMLDALPLGMSIWPQARVVFCRRRGLENLESRRRKFPGEEFVGHCKDWSAVMLKWRALERGLPRPQRVEIDQHELATDPASAAERLARFLGLESAQQSVLREHLETQAPERTTDDWRPVDFDALAWSETERSQFVEICGGAMDAFGYSLDGSYWKDAPEPVSVPAAGAEPGPE